MKTFSIIFVSAVVLALSVKADAVPGMPENTQWVAESKADALPAKLQKIDFTARYKEAHANAEKGNALAMFQVGLLLAEGRGVSKDLKQAYTWIEKAAGKEFIPAYNFLGDLHRFGSDEIKQSNETAIKWYKKAALRGLPVAQVNTGSLIAIDAKTEDTRKEAYQWIALGSQQLEGEQKKIAEKNAALLKEKLSVEALSAADKWIKEFKPEGKKA